MLRRTVFCVFLFLSIAAPAAYALDLMLPRVFLGTLPPGQWLVSEKLDGVRGYWDGRRLYSKHGRIFQPPAAFTANFPPFAVEGEIWGGRGTFERTAAIVRRPAGDPGWLQLQLAVFDVPCVPGGFEARLARARDWLAKHPAKHAFVITHQPVADAAAVRSELARIEGLGGEGLVLRKSGSPYVAGRSPDVLKVKSYDDREAEVVAWLPGAGRNRGRLGALLVELPESGLRFKIGTGFSDEVRLRPPPVGSLVTFKFYGNYESGLPRFPAYLHQAPPE